MRPRDPRPWSATDFRLASSALRECVARVEFMDRTEIRVLCKSEHPSLTVRVARWRAYHSVLYAELVVLLGQKRRAS